MPIQGYGTAAPRIGKVAPGRGIIRSAMKGKAETKPAKRETPAPRKGRY